MADEADETQDEGADLPGEEELREALDRVGVSDVLLNALSATASLGFRRVSAEARDLPQARLAIEALRALEPVLREGGVDDALVRDLEQARMNLQLAYAKAVESDTVESALELDSRDRDLRGLGVLRPLRRGRGGRDRDAVRVAVGPTRHRRDRAASGSPSSLVMAGGTSFRPPRSTTAPTSGR